MRENVELGDAVVPDVPDPVEEPAKSPEVDHPKRVNGSGATVGASTGGASTGEAPHKMTAEEYKEFTKDSAGKSEAKIELPVGGPGGTKGPAVDDALITGLISRKMKDFARCRRSNGGQMKVVIRFAVQGGGEVGNVAVDLPGGADELVKNCVAGIVGKWRFPPTDSPKQFTKTLLL